MLKLPTSVCTQYVISCSSRWSAATAVLDWYVLTFALERFETGTIKAAHIGPFPLSGGECDGPSAFHVSGEVGLNALHIFEFG